MESKGFGQALQGGIAAQAEPACLHRSGMNADKRKQRDQSCGKNERAAHRFAPKK
jgi:hypothetical protein